MSAIITLIQVLLVTMFLLNSVESVRNNVVLKKDALSSSSRVIVQFTGPAGGDLLAQQREGVSGEDLEANAVQQRNKFIDSLKTTGLNQNIVHTYSKLFNGVSLNLDNPNDFNTLKSMPGVLEVYEVQTYNLNPLLTSQSPNLVTEPSTSDVFKQTAHIMTGVDIIHREHPELTGQEVRVGIIDSGIDYRHPAFSIPGQNCTDFKGPGCRVIFGTDFVGDYYDGKGVPLPDDDPMDTCNGHGTHVAGIVGGSDTKVKGVAQGVVFGAYRVFGCDGSTTDDVVIAALDAALVDRMQVINLSIGQGMYENTVPLSQTIDKLSQMGIIITLSAGNEGEEGYGTVGSPGVSKLAIGVASYDNSQSYGTFFNVKGAPGLDLVAFRLTASVGVFARFNETEPLNLIVSPQQTSDLGDGCTPFQAGTFENGVALIFRSGVCKFTDMVSNAVKNGGARGVIIYNSFPGDFTGALDPITANFPTVFIAGVDGVALSKAATESGSVSVSFEYNDRLSPIRNAGVPSEFSSMGLDLSLLMKPDLGAPGGYIISSIPRFLGSYAEYSGTSMAAPYIAGVAALEVQKSNGKTTFSSFQRRLHITAKPSMISDSADGGIAMTVAKTGAGMVDVHKFLFSPVDIEPSKLELGDGTDSKTRTIEVTNNGDQALSYEITHMPSESFLVEGGVPQHLIKKDPLTADLTFSVQTITIPPGRTETFDVTIAPKASTPHLIRSGFIKLENNLDPKGSLSIPYALMTGEYSTLPLIGTKVPPGLYPESVKDDSSLPPFGDTDLPTFDLRTKATTPVFVFELVFPVRRFEVLLFTADTNTAIGSIYSNSYRQPFDLYPFLLESTVFDLTDPTRYVDFPDGKYKIVVRAVLPRPLTPVPDVKAAMVTIHESVQFFVDRTFKLTTTATTMATPTATPTSVFILPPFV